jgi:hypothetical protein
MAHRAWAVMLVAPKLGVMNAGTKWIARAWLPYLLAGIGQIIIGAVVLGDQRGEGLIFVGLSCVSLGGYGAILRMTHGRRPGRRLPRC